MFKKFIKSLETDTNKKLIESILQGYSSIFESFDYASKSGQVVQDFIIDVGPDTYKRLKKKYKRKHGEDRIKYIDKLRRKYEGSHAPVLESEKNSINLVRYKKPNLNEEMPEIIRTAKELKIDKEKLVKAYDDAKLIELTDKIWSEMDNTDSYHEIKKGDLKTVKKLAKEYGRNVDKILDAYEKGETLPSPIVLKYENGYYLIGGNTRLMIAKAMGKNPKILLLDITKKTIIESSFAGKTLVVVDIQPEYEKGFSFETHEFIEFLNQNHEEFSNIVILYNGAETLGMISEGDYHMWLVENGLEEDILNDLYFYDKGYAFFRYCIDESIDEEQIVNLVKFMKAYDINDSRDMTKEKWLEFVKEHGDEDIRELLEFSDDMINIPDLMDELDRYNNIVLTGGGVDECLKEVELSLDALGKSYKIFNTFTY